MRIFRSAYLVAPIVAALTLSGCASDADNVTETSSDARVNEFAPVTIENCGIETTFETSPEKILTLNVTTDQIVIALGAADRLVGRTELVDDNVAPLDEYAAAYDALSVVGTTKISGEAIAETGAELVIDAWDSLSEDKGRSPEQLATYGVNSFGMTEYCDDRGFEGFATLKKDITDLGAILGLQKNAAELVANLDADIQSLSDQYASTEDVPTFYYDSGTDSAYSASQVGVLGYIAEHAKAPSIIDQGDEPFVDVSWETIGEAQPEVIVILDSSYAGSVEDKIATLEANPVMATTPAVMNDRYVAIDMYLTFESVTLPNAIAQIAEGVHATT